MESNSGPAADQSSISFVTNTYVPAYGALVSALRASGKATVLEIGEGLSRVTLQTEESTGDPTSTAITTARAILTASHLPLQWEAHAPADKHTASFVAALTERLARVKVTDTVRAGSFLQPLVNGSPVYVDRIVYAAVVDAADISAAPGHNAYADPLATLALQETDPSLLDLAIYALDRPEEIPILLTPADISTNIDYLRSEGWWLAHMHVSSRPSCPRCKESREVLSQWPYEERAAGRATYFRFSSTLAQFDVRMVPSERLWLEEARLDIAHGSLPLIRVTEFVGRIEIDPRVLQLAAWLAYVRLLPRYPELLFVLVDTEGAAAEVHDSLAISLRVASFEQLASFVVHMRELLSVLSEGRVESQHASSLNEVFEARRRNPQWVAGRIGRDFLLLRPTGAASTRLREISSASKKLSVGQPSAMDSSIGHLNALGFFEWSDEAGTVSNAAVPGSDHLDIRIFPSSFVVMYGYTVLLELALTESAYPNFLTLLRDAWKEGRLQDPWTLHMLQQGKNTNLSDLQPRFSRLLLKLFGTVLERLDAEQSRTFVQYIASSLKPILIQNKVSY